MEDVALSEIATRYGTPTYVYSGGAIDRSIESLRHALRDMDASICFAVKANSNLSILSRIARSGLGADLVSGGELTRAIEAGFQAEKIVFSGVGKQEWEIQSALGFGIHSFNVESVAELALIEAVARKSGARNVKIALRFNPDVDAKTHPYISTGLRENKFGLNRKEVMEVVRSRARYPSLVIVGLSIHIGSQLLSLRPLDEAFEMTARLISELRLRHQLELEFVDLGGGLGIQYKKETPPSLEKYAALIRKYFARLPVFLEPGRSLVGNSGLLLTRVLLTKPRGKKSFLVVDAAMNDLMRPSLYGSYHEIVPTSQGRSTPATYDIVGPVCESADSFACNRKFQKRLGPGDLLAILSAGAYGFSMASQYNSRPRPAEVLVNGSEISLIRRRETFEDLLAPERFSDTNA